MTESNQFDLVGFIPLLRERIYSNNQYARQFIISWVGAHGLCTQPLKHCGPSASSVWASSRWPWRWVNSGTRIYLGRFGKPAEISICSLKRHLPAVSL